MSENKKPRGKLTVFLGAASGVGKTYAMLEAARERRLKGTDVVVGWVETHGEPETEAILSELEVIPPLEINNKGSQGREMNLDAILFRHPHIVLVDELAHSNVPGARHSKRYLDVEEILSAGINIHTTLNIQNLESQSDIAARITGYIVRETVPDSLLKEADIQIVDISSAELIQRVKEGKVKLSGWPQETVEKFYRLGNINAMRELTMRYTAQKVDRQMENYMRDHAIEGPWPVGEKVLVCISPSPFSAQLLRHGSRLATSLQAEWLVVYVETPQRVLDDANRDRLARNLRHAGELGAEVIRVTGQDVAEEILHLAKKRNITHLVMGKPLHSRAWDFLRGSPVEKTIRNSEGIIVHVIPGKKAADKEKGTKPLVKEETTILRYLQVLLIIAVMTVLFRPFGALLGTVNVAMIFLLPVLYFAATAGRSLAIAAASLGILAFDFFFIPPPHTFRVEDLRYVLSFAIFLLVAVLTSSLATRLRHQVLSSRKREETMQALYSLSKEIAAKTELSHVLEIAAKRVADSVDGQVQIMLPDNKGSLVPTADSGIPENSFPQDHEMAVAMWVYENSQMAGKGTETLAGSRGTYIPLLTEQGVVGVMAVIIAGKEPYLSAEQRRLLEAFASLTALAINRIHLAEKARENQLLAETERLYTALFNCLSHDLRTPLTSITGAVTGLLEENEVYGPGEKRELLQAIRQGAARMNRLVNNLLDMARLESGVLRLNKEWCDIQEIISVAVGQLEPQRRELLQMEIDHDLPFVWLDFVLIEQVLVNLLDNAFKYSEYSKVAILARRSEGFIEVSISDQGTGIPEEELERVFDKFYRLRASRQVSGTGLGLTICKSIIEAHSGIIRARNNPERGTTISFTLPLSDEQPGTIPAAGKGDEHGR